MTIPIDDNGYIPVKNRLLSKVGVFPYLGSSIGATDPNKVYMVYRPETELSNEETINSFKLVPLIDEHEMLGKDATAPEKKGIHGTSGEDVYFDNGLFGNLKVYSESMKNLIEGGKKELSLGYKCKYIFESGEYNGQKYDAIQTSIRGNHIALVDEGRMGKEVSVVDEALKTVVTMDRNDIKQGEIMTEEQLKALMDALNSIGSKLDTLVSTEKEEIVEDENPTNEATDKDVKAEDEEISKAMDSLKKENEALSKKLDGMDSAIETKVQERIEEIKAIDSMTAKAKDFIGAFDSKETLIDNAKYILDKLGMDSVDGQEVATINGYLAGAKIQTNGMDKQDKKVYGTSFDVFDK